MTPIVDQVLYALAAAVVSGVGAALLALIPKGIAYLEVQAQSIPDAQARAAVAGALAELETVITAVVASLDQTTVSALKAASATGKLTAEQAAQVKAKAEADIEAILGAASRQVLADHFGNLPALISHLIEAAVLALKPAGGTAPPLP